MINSRKNGSITINESIKHKILSHTPLKDYVIICDQSFSSACEEGYNRWVDHSITSSNSAFSL